MRQASTERKTKETQIKASWNLDGTGKHSIKTPMPFFNHMLELFAKHGFFDITISATGDVDVDDHHTVEDLGIVLGTIFKEAVADKKGIFRYGSLSLPMDEALVLISLDISNRPFLNYNITYPSPLHKFDIGLIKEFLAAFTLNAGITLHLKLLAGDNAHHIAEAIFKGLAKALHHAVQINPKETDIPSTKGIL